MHGTPSRDGGDARATGQPQGLGIEGYFASTSQGARPEDARQHKPYPRLQQVVRAGCGLTPKISGADSLPKAFASPQKYGRARTFASHPRCARPPSSCRRHTFRPSLPPASNRRMRTRKVVANHCESNQHAVDNQVHGYAMLGHLARGINGRGRKHGGGIERNPNS